MASFTGLGRALRWIRQRQGKKQYEVADAASITKAMLSSYENEKQKPAIDTLERILDALEIDLDYLAYAIRVVRQEEERKSGVRTPPAGHTAPPALDTYHDLERTLGLDHRLDAAEEQAVAQMLEGFHGLLRYMLKRSGDAARGPRPAPDPPPSPPPDVGSDEEE
jgi:transcriptional regulator with XRE-family HTH domain